MAIEGELTVRLNWNGRRVTAVDIRSTRPFAAARILAGKSPSRAAAMVAMLYSVCGVAQRAAANGALAAAGASDVKADSQRSERAVGLEAIQEHFWRLLIDWPQAMGRAPNSTPVAAARYRIAAAAGRADGGEGLDNAAVMRDLGVELSRLAEQAIYGMAPAAWMDIATLPELDEWIAGGRTECARLLHDIQTRTPTLGRCDVELMPAACRQTMLDVVLPALDRDPDFARRPTWGGRPVETGALARERSHPLVSAMGARAGHTVATRFVARLVDLAALISGLGCATPNATASPRVQSFAVAPDGGLAAIQTARGLLVHRVHLDRDAVADYCIVAPTEWNFHPQGALAQGLAQIAANARLEVQQQARLVVQTLDPCVVCNIEVADA